MKIVLQRVLSASVKVDGVVVGAIGRGYLLFVGIAADDDEQTVRRLACDVSKARLMEDAAGKMGVALAEAGGEALAVSQFTLLADFSKGNRPSFNGFNASQLMVHLGRPVPTGVFGADMKVELLNDGPVTVVLE